MPKLSQATKFKGKKNKSSAAEIIGAASSLPKLTAGTVWLSGTAARDIWGTDAAIAKSSVSAEAARRLALSRALLSRCQPFEAFSQIYVSCSLLDAFSPLVDCAKGLSHKSLGVRLNNAIRHTSLVRLP